MQNRSYFIVFLRPARASPWLGVERKTRDRRETWMNAKTKRLFCRLKKRTQRHCGRQEEPVILISRLLLRMPGKYVASFIWTSTKNEWNAQNARLLRAFRPSITRYLITRVLAIYHEKRTQNKPQCWSNTAFDLRSFRPHSLTFGYF